MELTDAIKLIKQENVPFPASTKWADLGAGAGLFTQALAQLLQPGSSIYAIDKISTVWIKYQNPGDIHIEKRTLNFMTDELGITNLDGILMANSLHFVENKLALIHKLCKSLKVDGVFLIVEYDTKTSNQWVPYPVSFDSLKEVFQKAGYARIIKLGERPSVFRKSLMYSAYITR